jgi:hypothetical protein
MQFACLLVSLMPKDGQFANGPKPTGKPFPPSVLAVTVGPVTALLVQDCWLQPGEAPRPCSERRCLARQCTALAPWLDETN